MLTLIIVSGILDFIRKPEIPPEINATALYDLQGNGFFLPQIAQDKPVLVYFGERGAAIVDIPHRRLMI
ncbi:Uncharacterised protein [Rodentibacter pneumotropicus]|uniref:Uncharacterized protein n=1 Tax=Rodentibacter pneumotropicus TaxID=758 RepID=A0A448MIH1_9PAST|nr:Uncharacterised protein [Rodentibacter pneumotropicus]